MVKELVCINCPMSCHLKVTLEGSEVVKVEGNTCPRGDRYAHAELTNPMRMVTSTVEIEHGMYHCLPVITSGEIPKDKMFDVMKEIQKTKVCAPIHVNDIIIKNICGLGVDIIASKSMERC